MIIESMSVSSLLMMVRGANLPPIIAWKVSNTLGSFSFSRSNLSLACFGLPIFFSGEGGRSSSASRDHFQCLLLESFVFWQCLLLIGSASSPECNQSGCGVAHLCYAIRSGELRMQKLKSHLVRTQSLNVLPFKPGVGQYIAIHATLTAREFLLAYFYPSSPFTCIFSETSPNFFLCWPAE